MHNYAAMLPVVDDDALAGEYAEKIMAGICLLYTSRCV